MMSDPNHRAALDVLTSYLSAMEKWEEKAHETPELLLPKGDPALIAARGQIKMTLDNIHELYCLPSEWTQHLCYSHPTTFQVHFTAVEQLTRNRLLIHVRHNSLGSHYQFELRRMTGTWKVAWMWQYFPDQGKRFKCFF